MTSRGAMGQRNPEHFGCLSLQIYLNATQNVSKFIPRYFFTKRKELYGMK